MAAEMDCVQRCYMLQSTSPNNKVLIERFQRELSGKITRVAWNKLPEGIAESMDMVFPDETQIRATRFLQGPEKGITFHLKRIT